MINSISSVITNNIVGNSSKKSKVAQEEKAPVERPISSRRSKKDAMGKGKEKEKEDKKDNKEEKKGEEGKLDSEEEREGDMVEDHSNDPLPDYKQVVDDLSVIKNGRLKEIAQTWGCRQEDVALDQASIQIIFTSMCICLTHARAHTHTFMHIYA